MLSRLTGMFRDIAMAYAFGTQSAIAALLVAFRFAHLLRRLLGEGAMQTAFIPHFEELRNQDPKRAGEFFVDLKISLSILLTVIILLSIGGFSAILYLVPLSDGNKEILWLTLLMMPSLLFICLFGINAALLQCEKSYFSSSAAPIAFNLLWVVGVFCTMHLPNQQAMTGLALFVVLACMAQWAFTLPKTQSIVKSLTQKNRPWKSYLCFSPDVLRLAKPLSLGVFGIAASQINNALDAVFARWADDSGPALLWYSIRIQQLPLALFGIAISGALLPPLARAMKAHEMDKFRQFLDFALRRSLTLMIPITVFLFILGGTCVQFLYGRGDFTEASVSGTTHCLWGYNLGLIPMALVLIIAPAFYSAGDYKTPSIASLASMILNIILNFLLVGVLGMGAASIAVATSLSSWFNLMWLGIAISYGNQIHCGNWITKKLIQNILVTSAVSVGATTIVWILKSKIDTIAFSSDVWRQIALLSVGGLLFGAIVLFPLIKERRRQNLATKA